MSYVREIVLPPTERRDGVTARLYEVSSRDWPPRGFESRPPGLPRPSSS
jgi:hypothetical protein